MRGITREENLSSFQPLINQEEALYTRWEISDEEMDRQQQVIENGYIIEAEHELTGPQTMVAPPMHPAGQLHLLIQQGDIQGSTIMTAHIQNPCCDRRGPHRKNSAGEPGLRSAGTGGVGPC